jgi:hypothetical protein
VIHLTPPDVPLSPVGGQAMFRVNSTREDEHALRLGLAPYSDDSDVARVLADRA